MGQGTQQSLAADLAAPAPPERRELVVPGKPMTMARVRFKRNGPAYTPQERVVRQADFQAAWQDHYEPFERGVPLAVELEFVFARPAGHFGTGRNAGILKASAPARPGAGANGGDVDNLAKLVTDGIEGVAYWNDTQIAELIVSKRYARDGEAAFTRVAIVPL